MLTKHPIEIIEAMKEIHEIRNNDYKVAGRKYDMVKQESFFKR